MAIFGHYQSALIFPILAVFWSRFLQRTTATCCRNVFSMFLCMFCFWPKWQFCKVYSLCLVAIFGHFQNALIFPILAVFRSRFCIEQLQCVVETFLACFYAFLIFDPKWRFCKVYGFCLVAILGHFQNALIFAILAVFWSRFLHRTTAMCCKNVFSMFLCIFNFRPKATILQSL